MVGGDLHWIWKPYALYQEVDYVRSIESLDQAQVYILTETFCACGDRYTASRPCRKTTDLPMLRASSCLPWLSLDVLTSLLSLS